MGLAKYCEGIAGKLLDDSERFNQEHLESAARLPISSIFFR